MGGHVEGQHTHVLGRDRQQQEDQKQMVLKRKCNRNCVYLIDCILGQPCLKTEAVQRSSTTPDDAFDPVEDLLIVLTEKQQEVSKARVASIHTQPYT